MPTRTPRISSSTVRSPLLPSEQDIVAGMDAGRRPRSSERIEFFIGPVPGSPAFPDGTPGHSHTAGIGTPATVCSGEYALPVFHINMCLTDAVEEADWRDQGVVRAVIALQPQVARSGGPP
ncbi:MAG: hypothetical protein IPH09_11130 [bacterium]|nr:hypothetical protein [bacterium]